MDYKEFLDDLAASGRTMYGQTPISEQVEEQQVFSTVWALIVAAEGDRILDYLSSGGEKLVSITLFGLKQIRASRGLECLNRVGEVIEGKGAVGSGALEEELSRHSDYLVEKLYEYVIEKPEIFLAEKEPRIYDYGIRQFPSGHHFSPIGKGIEFLWPHHAPEEFKLALSSVLNSAGIKPLKYNYSSCCSSLLWQSDWDNPRKRFETPEGAVILVYDYGDGCVTEIYPDEEIKSLDYVDRILGQSGRFKKVELAEEPLLSLEELERQHLLLRIRFPLRCLIAIIVVYMLYLLFRYLLGL